jgi:hypothetical protein
VGFYSDNHLYIVPASQNDNIAVAVGFLPQNKSTHAQHRYTTWVTHRSEKEVAAFPDPLVGGVYRFAQVWAQYFGG